MNVAVMYSGGKDSNYAVEHALQRGWNIKYLLSVKPTRTDCYLFHYATVEHTPLQAEALGLKHYLLSCDVANPVKEAAIIEKFVAEKQKTKEEEVDAVILGGVGLQETQIRSLQQALMPLGIEVFAAHSGFDHLDVLKEMLNKGYEIIITQVAAEGLPKWLGRVITKENVNELAEDSVKYGFHVGGEGGSYDSFVTDGPAFKKRIVVEETKKVIENAYCGHVLIKRQRLVVKDKLKKIISGFQ